MPLPSEPFTLVWEGDPILAWTELEKKKMKKLLLAAMVLMAGCAHAGVRPPRADEVRIREIEQSVLDERNAEMYQQLRWADSTAYVVASSNAVNCPDDASVSRVGITSVDENHFSAIRTAH